MAFDALSGTLDVPGLKKIVDQLGKFITDDQELRAIQSAHAAQIAYFGSGTLDENTIVNISQAQDGSVKFSYLVVMFDESAGRGRYTIHGQPPTKGGFGFPIPSGYSTVTVHGSENIRAFQMIAQTGYTLPFSWGLFR